MKVCSAPAHALVRWSETSRTTFRNSCIHPHPPTSSVPLVPFALVQILTPTLLQPENSRPASDSRSVIEALGLACSRTPLGTPDFNPQRLEPMLLEYIHGFLRNGVVYPDTTQGVKL